MEDKMLYKIKNIDLNPRKLSYRNNRTVIIQPDETIELNFIPILNEFFKVEDLMVDDKKDKKKTKIVKEED
jgi:hypothetical protein